VSGVPTAPTVLRVGSGLIYAVLILLWAIYFIPRWLRRHDQLSESRSVEKFDQAMRILSRRDPVPDQRYVVMPPRPEEPARTPRGRTPVPPVQPRRPSRPAASARDGRRATAIDVRRRRVLAVLLLLTAGLAAATLVAPVPRWAPAALLALTLVDLGHVRLQRRRRAALLRDRDAIRRRSDSRLRRHDSADRIVAARGVLAEQRAAAEAARVEQEWAAHESARRTAGRPVGTDDAAGSGWQPVPVPLPTYVTAPKAPRSSRPIDLTHPGKWSEQQAAAAGTGQVFDQTMEGSGYAPAEPAAPTVPAAADGRATASDAAREAAVEELDAILERRRAVND
jgi:hypothetical protein